MKCRSTLLAALAALSLCGSAGAGGQAKVVSVTNGGLLFTDNQAGVSGTDTGYSLPLGGKTLWMFGDAFLLDPSAPARRYLGGVSNCALLVPAGHGSAPLKRYQFLTDSRKGVARQIIPNHLGEGNETRLWPFGSWLNPATRQIYQYYAIVKLGGSGGPLDFKISGFGIAVGNAERPEKLSFARLPAPDGTDLWWKGRPVFGSAVLAPAGEMLYVYGWEENGGTQRPRLARVKKSLLTHLDAYEYLAGTYTDPTWSRKSSEAVDVPGLDGFPAEMSVSWNAYLGGYLAVCSGSIFSEKIRLSVAPQPWGPFTTIGEIGAPHQLYSQAFTYAAKEHPELRELGGKVIYITYVDSWRYWLQLLKVTLERSVPPH